MDAAERVVPNSKAIGFRATTMAYMPEPLSVIKASAVARRTYAYADSGVAEITLLFGICRCGAISPSCDPGWTDLLGHSVKSQFTLALIKKMPKWR